MGTRGDLWKTALFTGTFERAVDEKLRVAFPKTLREGVPGSRGVWYVAPGTDGSLVIYPKETFTQLAQRLAAAPPTQQDVRAFRRLFYAQAEHVRLDRQGRLRIPTRLAELAGVSKQVVLLGIQDHLELWDCRRWKRYLKQKSAQYDSIAESALGRSG